MKTNSVRIALSLLAAGLFSCQDSTSPSLAAESETPSLQLVARLTNAMGGDSIPKADTLHFRYWINKGVQVEASVPWTAHHIDFGLVQAGDSIHWQATGYTWTSGQRIVVWASSLLNALAKASGNAPVFTLETPVVAKNFVLPSAVPSFTTDSLGKVNLAYRDSNYLFKFTVPPSVVTVRVNGEPLMPHNSVCSLSVQLATGSKIMRVDLTDNLGAMAVQSYTLVRPEALPPGSVDSGSTAEFTTPSTASSTVPYGTSELTVTVKTTTNSTSLKTSSVDLNGVKMVKGDSVTWTLLVSDLKVGVDTILTATPYVGGTKGTPAIVTVKQLGPNQVDSGSSAEFTTPSTASSTVPYGTSTLNVTVKTNTKSASTKTSSVDLNGVKMVTGDSVTWTLSVIDLKVGVDTILTATPYVGGTKGTPAIVKVKQLGPDPVDSVVHVSITSPAPNTSYSNSTNSIAVSVKATSGLHVDSVKVSSQKLDSVNNDSLWKGTVTGLTVGSNTLDVIAYASDSKTGTAQLSVVRRDVAGVPQFSVGTGRYTAPQTVTLSTTPTNATIQYSTDSSKWTTGTQVTVSVPETLYVRAFATGRDTSYSRANYVIAAVAPTFTPGSGAFTKPQKVVIQSSDPQAIILWSTDKKSWKVYSQNPPDSIRVPTKLFAYDSVLGLANSLVSEDSITIQVSTPLFSPASGTYTGAQSVSISDSTLGATIEVSSDSADGSWKVYTGAIALTHSRKLYARASVQGLTARYATASYELQLPKPTLELSVEALGKDSLSATDSVGGVTFQYSLDNKIWHDGDGGFWTYSTGTVYVRVAKANWNTSAATSLMVSVSTKGYFKDPRDMQNYSWVAIGSQVWMADNLNYTPKGVDTGMCYQDDPSYCAIYGRLYTWNAVMVGAASSTQSPSGVKGICPSGWHVPSDDEWTTLVNTVEADNRVGSGHDGEALKFTSGWNNSGNGSDLFGFHALPGGFSNGSFSYVGTYAYWLSATESDTSNVWCHSMFYGFTTVGRDHSYKTNGYSLRCTKD